MATVYICHLEHRFGTDISVHTTEQGALGEVAEFVDAWWEKDGPKEPKPDDAAEARTAYFEFNEQESWTVAPKEVQGPAELIRIVYTEDDVRDIHEVIWDDPDIDPIITVDEALTRARDWSRHIRDTASSLCSDLLHNVITSNNP